MDREIVGYHTTISKKRRCPNSMVSLCLPIVKFILALKLEFSKPQLSHLFTLVHGIILCAGRKNMTQIRNAARGDRHLSNATNFLNHSPWCVNRMQRRRLQWIVDRIENKRLKEGDANKLVFLIVDDTCCKKDKSIRKSDLHSVTVEGQGVYRGYPYEGPVSEIENVKLLLSWKDDYTASSKPQVCLLCTDVSLDLVTIQRNYHIRWNIETGYRYFKELLGFDQYQLLSFTGIQRFWAIQFLTQNFHEYQRLEGMRGETDLTLGDVVRRIREEFFGQIIVYVYQKALEKKPLFDILRHLRLPA
ncbi:transposase [Paenibacillus darwinianus]|uniref:transposase n=1 Tax=Paenibacillus darwinianus TaxID=1380763 RepID=UPI001680E130|nr:transposase [Paenibacillus darwinianus]